jgi:hypothetical protein
MKIMYQPYPSSAELPETQRPPAPRSSTAFFKETPS